MTKKVQNIRYKNAPGIFFSELRKWLINHISNMTIIANRTAVNAIKVVLSDRSMDVRSCIVKQKLLLASSILIPRIDSTRAKKGFTARDMKKKPVLFISSFKRHFLKER